MWQAGFPVHAFHIPVPVLVVESTQANSQITFHVLVFYERMLTVHNWLFLRF
jgi:hypothetical protein